MVGVTNILTLLAATAVIATPVPNEEFSLEARAGQSYICRGGLTNKGELFGEVSQDRAIGFFRNAKTNTGASGYPKEFDNKGKVMKFAKGCTKDVWELPLLSTNKPYAFNSKKAGNRPGPLRVYYTKDLKFCGIGSKPTREGLGNPHNCEFKTKSPAKSKPKPKPAPKPAKPQPTKPKTKKPKTKKPKA
ncbi:hypothetical protein GGS23DRAFT_553125 [Durotheca rogersii]|uniref:uncharacterized protein n=1 Tax=Durotheca rogersii TaxID=419775 RepID=UPI0022211866|nr:uncharacterized protein GGS23DRAFT_553125 [Durotheca rogersii]KAI5867010.1 hypothetical protein GGS23DRAFT_553125 [Durotheca rogersii]